MSDIISNEIPDQLWYSECASYFKPYAKYKLLYGYSNTALHTHMDFYEITLIIKGSYYVHYNGETKCYERNALLFWGPDQTHSIYQNEPQSVHCTFIIHKETFISICEHFYPEISEMRFTRFTECTLSPENAAYLANISAKGVTQKMDYQDYLELFLRTAITHLFFKDTSTNNANNLDVKTCISDILLKLESQEYLLAPISRLYTLYPICRATLIKNFKEYTGYTIAEYRNKKRMEYGATLLSTQKYSVTQVASLVGISSFSYFSKKFHEYYGVLPSQYVHKYYDLGQNDPQNKL